MATAIHKEIEKLKTADVTDAELAMYKTRTRADLLRGLADNQGLANALAEYQTRYGDWRELFRQLDRVDKVTKADIRRVANEVFVASNRTSAEIDTQAPRQPGKERRRREVKNSDQWSVVSDRFGLSQSALARALFVAFSFLLIAGALPAQQSKPWEKIPVPPLHAFKPQQPKRIELKNGIVLFLQEDHELPFVSGSVLIPGGSRDEDPAKCGLDRLYGQTWRTSGSEKMDGDAMDDLLESKAAHIETGGDEDSTALSWDSLKADADQVYDLAMDLLFHPKFDEQKLRLAQQQTRQASCGATTTKARLPDAKRPSWCMELTAPTRGSRNCRPLGRSRWRICRHGMTARSADKLIISISGDFDSAAMEAKLRATFENLPQCQAKSGAARSISRAEAGVYFINKEDVNQSQVEIVGLGTDRRNPDVPSLAMMNDVFAGGFASRLFQKVRTELGLAYEVGGGLGFGWDHPATFQAVVLTQSATTVEAIQQTYKVMDGMTTQPFTEEELKRAKDNILNSFLFRYDTKDKVLAERVRLEFYGYPADYLETYKTALEKVTVADLNAVAKKYIHPDKYAVLVVGNGPEIKPGLDELKMGPVHKIDITIPGAESERAAGRRKNSEQGIEQAKAVNTKAGGRDYGRRQGYATEVAAAQGASRGGRKAAAEPCDRDSRPPGGEQGYLRNRRARGRARA